jgi:uncharacterized protein YaiE (UPF0345 family)
MPDTIPLKFDNAAVTCKANVYFDGKVVSHTVHVEGRKKTLGLIYPGTYKFNTDAPEKMEVTAGSARVRLAGETDWKSYGEGASFRVPGQSHFEIAVETGIAEYICSFE